MTKTTEKIMRLKSSIPKGSSLANIKGYKIRREL